MFLTEDHADDGQPAEGHATERPADGEHHVGGGEGRGGSERRCRHERHQKHRLTAKPAVTETSC